MLSALLQRRPDAGSRVTADNAPDFLARQAELAQALSGKPELKVHVGLNHVEDDPLSLRNDILIFRSSEGEPEQALRHLRGQVDLAALAHKYHDTQTHHHQRPRDATAADIFDALEKIRLEALGVEIFPGLKANLAARHAVAFQLQGYDRNLLRDAPPLPDVLAMLAREAHRQCPDLGISRRC
ncbi:MAG: hypothetical protein B7X02_02235 [Rhodospirillales bacterium 12-54-5]|nr:MAG: hypothetical protein B7X02_02235 [Rhodospirillales bacterium 12-54-5]